MESEQDVYKKVHAQYMKEYYHTTKEKFNARRKARYAETHPKKEKPVKEPKVKKEKVVKEKPIKVIPYKVIIRKVKLPNQTLVEIIELLKVRNPNQETYSRNVGILKILMHKIMGYDDFKHCVKDPAILIEKINTWKTEDGGLYSVGSKARFYSIILIVAKMINLEISPDYETEFELCKIAEKDGNAERMKTEVVPTFEEYLAKCKKTFGKFSKEYLLAKLYNELTVRDDFGLVVDEPDDGVRNFLIGDTIILNKYKTADKYGIVKHKLSSRLYKQIQLYIETNKIKGYLFGAKKLGEFINAMNKQMGYNGGVLLLRHIKVSDSLKKVTTKERVILAKKMCHSPSTQLTYERLQNKVEE